MKINSKTQLTVLKKTCLKQTDGFAMYEIKVKAGEETFSVKITTAPADIKVTSAEVQMVGERPYVAITYEFSTLNTRTTKGQMVSDKPKPPRKRPQSQGQMAARRKSAKKKPLNLNPPTPVAVTGHPSPKDDEDEDDFDF